MSDIHILANMYQLQPNRKYVRAYRIQDTHRTEDRDRDHIAVRRHGILVAIHIVLVVLTRLTVNL